MPSHVAPLEPARHLPLGILEVLGAPVSHGPVALPHIDVVGSLQTLSFLELLAPGAKSFVQNPALVTIFLLLLVAVVAGDAGVTAARAKGLLCCMF